MGDNRSWNDQYFREELFYQLGLRQFGDFSRIKLEPPPSLRSMIEIAVNADDSTENSRLSKNQIVDVRYFRSNVRTWIDLKFFSAHCGNTHGPA